MGKSIKVRANFRLTVLSMELCDAVASKMGFPSRTSVVEIAVRKYAQEVLTPRKLREVERGVEKHEELIALDYERQEEERERQEMEEYAGEE